MDYKTLQNTFDQLLPMNGEGCSEILKNISHKYKEVPEYSNECIYVGHTELKDRETGVLAKGLTKIGNSRYLGAINRGRSQGGGEWIFDFILFIPPEGINYTEIEKKIHLQLKEYKNLDSIIIDLYNQKCLKLLWILTFFFFEK